MKPNKKTLLPTIVLGAICLVVALLLATVNLVTKGVIEENDRLALERSLAEALPSEEGYEEIGITEPMRAAAAAASPQKITVTHIYRERGGNGYVVTLENRSGYTGKPIAITVGIDGAGIVTRALITRNPETKNTKEMAAYPDTFSGKNEEQVKDAELVAGVTRTSTAFRFGVAAAIAAVGAIGQ